MARKYETTDIDGIVYELHGVKSDGKKIGFVPVRCFISAEFTDFVKEATPGELDLIIDDWTYGNAVRLQGMARKAVEGEGFNDAAFGRIFNDTDIITKEVLMQYHGDSAGLRAYCKKIYEEQQQDVEVDEEHIWEELL